MLVLNLSQTLGLRSKRGLSQICVPFDFGIVITVNSRKAVFLQWLYDLLGSIYKAFSFL